MVVNVAGSITASGSTALEVLERSPGVIVNRQNNAISLSGKDGVIVMINGKINRMQKLKGSRQRQTGSAEERKRVGS